MIARCLGVLRSAFRRWWDSHVERELAKDADSRAEREAIVRRLEVEVQFRRARW